MKTKQRAIKVFYDKYGCQGYDDLLKALNNGRFVKRMDYLYGPYGDVYSNVYILEKETEA